MLETMKNLNKKTKVVLLIATLLSIICISGIVTACNMINADINDNTPIATESATEPTELATEEVTETATEEATEETTEKATEETTEEATEKPTEKKDKSDSDKDKEKDKENDKEEATVIITTTTTGENNSNNNTTNNNTSTGNTTNNNTQTNTNTNNNTTTNNNTNNTTTTSKVWHEAEYKTVHHPAETKKVWVVDQEGYTYEEPVYEEIPVTICYVCDLDITGNVSTHMKEVHVPKRESANYGVETRSVQTGTKTVKVEEKGHWETQVVKEAWDEQVLIREAGYY